MNETIFNQLYDFVGEMTPDSEMVIDYCNSQGIEITEDTIDVINDLIWNQENS